MNISSKHSRIFGKRTAILTHGFSLLVHAYKAGKITEIISFVVWELAHKLNFYDPGRYLTFTNDDALIRLDSKDERVDLTALFNAVNPNEFSLTESAIDWQLFFEDDQKVKWGSLTSDNKVLFRKNSSESLVRLHNFQSTIKAVYVSTLNVVFVCIGGTLYRSVDQGVTFDTCLPLASPVSYFLPNNGMTELPDGTLLLGEYGSVWQTNTWQNLAYLYHSYDQGVTWHKSHFLGRAGVNKHVHLIKYSNLLNVLFLTDGDNKKKVWVNEALNEFDQRSKRGSGGWNLINRFHIQTGGYTSMADGCRSILFGTDYLGGTNFIVSTKDGRTFTKQIISDPYRRSPVMNMVVRKSVSNQEVWAILHNSISSHTKCLLMYTKDEGKTWNKVIEYDGTRHEIKIINSSTKVSDSLYINLITTNGDSYQVATYKIWTDE